MPKLAYQMPPIWKFGVKTTLEQGIRRQSPDRRTNFQPGPGPEPGPVLILCTVHVHPTKIGS
jgi:hypothetical protein